MPEQPSEPKGLVDEPDFITPAEERQVLDVLEAMELTLEPRSAYVLARLKRMANDRPYHHTRARGQTVTPTLATLGAGGPRDGGFDDTDRRWRDDGGLRGVRGGRRRPRAPRLLA